MEARRMVYLFLAVALTSFNSAVAQYSCSTTDISPELVEDCVNAVRSDPGTWGGSMCGGAAPSPAMWADSALTTAAQWHTADMAARGYFAHGDFSGRIRNAGFGGGAIAENLANGYNTAFDVVAGWMCSPGHRANLVNCDFDSMGTAVDCSGGIGCLTTQTYGCSSSNCCYGGGRGAAPAFAVAGETDTRVGSGSGFGFGLGFFQRDTCLLPIFCNVLG